MGRLSHLVRSDLRDLENVKEIDKVETLAESLPPQSRFPLSYNSLAEDLETAPKKAKRWVGILDSFYYCFRLLGRPPRRGKANRGESDDDVFFEILQIRTHGVMYES